MPRFMSLRVCGDPEDWLIVGLEGIFVDVSNSEGIREMLERDRKMLNILKEL